MLVPETRTPESGTRFEPALNRPRQSVFASDNSTAMGTLIPFRRRKPRHWPDGKPPACAAGLMAAKPATIKNTKRS